MDRIAEAKESLKELIDIYNQNKDDKSFISNEKQACQHLIIPFIRKVLHWNTENPSEFKAEYSQGGKRIDYVVCNQGISQFIVEAKAPSKDIFDNDDFYQQAIDYGYGKEHDFAILTNFRQIVILAPNKSVRVVREAAIRKIDLLSLTDEDLSWLLCFEHDFWLNTKESPLYGLLKKYSDKVPVSDKLLDDMKHWRELLLTNIKKNSPHNHYDFEDEEERMHIEEEVQRLIDRLIFVCFCEDKELREPELKGFIQDKKNRFPLKEGYLLEKIRELFVRYKATYNSDLFDKGDCDNFHLDDDRIFEVLEGLREPKGRVAYDFKSIEADILGKVYENFIGHLTTGKKRFDEKEDKGKRKSSGIYYTPKYIVDYIVNNTVREYIKGKSFEEINKARILDPACGSGSFLLRAFDVLVEESKKSLKKDSLTYEEKRDLMLNCIHGVDLDKRAVEVAKLSLSLRLVERDKKLPMLGDNIQSGNSLIDDKKVAPWYAFVWEEQFKEIMQKGGFDIVIGNPPYIRVQTSNPAEKNYLAQKYLGARGKYDIYVLFIERALSLLKEGVLFSFIVPNKFTQTRYGEALKEHILNNYTLEQFLDFGDLKVFEEATTYPCIIVIRKEKPGCRLGTYVKVKKLSPEILRLVSQKIGAKYYDDENFTCFNFKQQNLNKENWSFMPEKLQEIYDKIADSSKTKLKDLTEKNVQGFITGDNESFMFKAGNIPDIESTLLKKVPKGKNVQKYVIIDDGYKVLYTNLTDKKPLSLAVLQKNPRTLKYLNDRQSQLKKRKFFGKQMSQFSEWWQLVHPLEYKYFERPKIITPNLSPENRFVFDEEGFFVEHDCYIIILKSNDANEYKYITALLNSKAVEFFFKQKSPMFSGGYYKYHTQYLDAIPIPDANSTIRKKLVRLVDDIVKLKRKLISFGNKQTDEKTSIEKEIQKLGREIDEEVYNLYGITEEEKRIIEDSLK